MNKITKKRIPWNKGLKGAQVAWNKGLHINLNPEGSFKKGQEPWNKNTKGVMKPNKTSFVKGQTAHNKGVYTATTIASIHTWIKGIKGKPNKCEDCGTTTAKAYHWSNIDHKYSKNPEDYRRLCVSCHLKYDYKFNGRKGNKNLFNNV